MGVMAAWDAAQKWNITQQSVAVLCREGRIPGAQRIDNMWLIPDETDKPTDWHSSRYVKANPIIVKPFVKWAGGKGQLLSEIRNTYPEELGNRITKYAEPFVGGGAVFFDIISNYDLDEIYIGDINSELINAYRTIRDNVNGLIELLIDMQDAYLPRDDNERKDYYYAKRNRFNELKVSESSIINIEKAALFIFLNRTCFNGLYRVNHKNMFNVPIGSYKKPLICDADNLQKISSALKRVTIVNKDYSQSADFIDANTFVYFDPPYRPLNATSSFTSYTEDEFNDTAQIELAKFVQQLDSKGAYIAVSNSDPKNADPNDNFFDNIYSHQHIKRVSAARMINSNANSRGKISELLICNY